jgi:hypothetical protein
MSVLLKRFRLAKRPHEKSLFARIIAMTAIEFLDDINTLIGRDLLKDLSKEYFKELVPVFKEINKKFNKLKSNNEALLRQIRNNACAHKSLDSLSFLKWAYEIDMTRIYLLGIEIKVISAFMSKELVKVSRKIAEIMSEASRLYKLLQKEKDKPSRNLSKQ